MEWLDSIIVIASFIVDLVIIFHRSIFAEISLLFISLRLWRVVRIINSVAQTIRSEVDNKKKHLATSYHEVIEVLLAVSEKKTAVISELSDKKMSKNSDNTLEKFKRIDESYRAILEHCSHPSSLDAVNEMTHHLQDIKEKLQLVS
ncbi:unnamed protein product [Rotaria sordida]|uniref:Voltage-gated hydrogen channel 1 n=1 Tax=Rotaria sordida TaxID=392033 RepID=A0A815MWB5_9BILA|nr:unnamed protein product [Rotaria sordida]CAF1421552.1 unnamed protein product [Rotaria sordida]